MAPLPAAGFVSAAWPCSSKLYRATSTTANTSHREERFTRLIESEWGQIWSCFAEESYVACNLWLCEKWGLDLILNPIPTSDRLLLQLKSEVHCEFGLNF